jgi:arabinogalactan endo-1,4-beta-galactosidase
VRLRLWVDPPAGYSDLPSVLATARRAKAAGMRLLLDPHYSDFWADQQKQPIPASWPHDLPALATTVHDYTRDALDALAAQGTPAQMLQLGNEIRNGMWPTGQLDGSADPWDRLGTLLRAAAAGARDAKAPTPRLVVHYDQYGWTLDNGDQESNFLWTPDLLVPGYPATPNGQLGFAAEDLLSILAAVPNGGGLGVFYWQPEWIPGVGWQPGAGTPNDNLTLFDFGGQALPGVSFADPLRAFARYAPALAGACSG